MTIGVYKATKEFPREELFGITSQMRRAASSIGANIAEGTGRRSDGELTRYLHIARGSAAELEYHLLLARDLDLLSSAKCRCPVAVDSIFAVKASGSALACSRLEARSS